MEILKEIVAGIIVVSLLTLLVSAALIAAKTAYDEIRYG
jgi:hypothetical protein